MYQYDYENRLIQLNKTILGSGIATGKFAYDYDHHMRRLLRDESGAGGAVSKLVFNADTTCRNTPWAEFLVPRCDTSVVQIGSVDAGVHQEFILVNFTDFGESSLDILVYYFTSPTAWLDHMDIRQRINIKIMKAIQERGLSVAFPTRSLQFEGPAASKLAGVPYQSRWGDAQGLPGDFGPDTPA